MPQATEQAQNDQVEQLAANRLTIPQDAIASLLQRLVRHALVSGSTHECDREAFPAIGDGLLSISRQLL